jgi:hypothetical protein
LYVLVPLGLNPFQQLKIALVLCETLIIMFDSTLR